MALVQPSLTPTRVNHLAQMELDQPPDERPAAIDQVGARYVDPAEALRFARVGGKGRKAQTDLPGPVVMDGPATLARAQPPPATLKTESPPTKPSPPAASSSGGAAAVAIDNGGAAAEDEPGVGGAGAAAPAKRQRRQRRVMPPDMVNPTFVTDNGTLAPKVAGARSSVKMTPELLAKRRRHQLAAQRAVQFPRMAELTWRPPNMDRPIEARAELTQQMASTSGPGMMVDSRWLGRDAITGLSIDQMRAHDPEMAGRTLPMSDFHSRFDRATPQELNVLHAALVSRLNGIQVARYEAVQTGKHPTLRTTSSAALLSAMLRLPPTYERVQELVSIQNVNGHLRQGALPSVPELTMVQIRAFLRPPNMTLGERPCVAQERCSARNIAHCPDLNLTSPLQWGKSSQRAQRHRDVVSVYNLCEYLSPEELERFQRDKQLPEQQGFCIVCLINATNIQYFSSLRQCTTDRDYSWMAELQQRYEAGEIGADELNRELHDVTKRCDIAELTRQFAGFQPFKVRIGPGEWPPQACLNIMLGSRESSVLYPFPIYETHLFRWACERDSYYLEIVPDDNPWGVSQIWPQPDPREGPAAAEERVPMLSLGRFYRGLATLEAAAPAGAALNNHHHSVPRPVPPMAPRSGAKPAPAVPTFAPLPAGCNGAQDLLHNQYVLCPFEQTVDALRKGMLRPRTPREYHAVWFPVHPDKSSQLAADEPLPVPQYAILAALAHRISVAYTEYHRLMTVRRTYFTENHPDAVPAKPTRAAADEADETDPEMTARFGKMAPFMEYLDILYTEQCNVYDSQRALRKACFQWKLYLTTHFALAHYLWLRPSESNAWTDAALLEQADAHTLSPYEAYYPDEHSAISVGMLPRLTHTMANLGWFCDTQEKRVPLSHLMRKALNIICAIRGWPKIMNEYCERYDGIVEFLNLCTMVSCLRLYPHSDECFTMDMAMHQWHHFNVSVHDAEANRAWREQHSILIWFSLREFQLYLVKQLPPLYYVLTRYNNLPAVAQSCSAGLDHACQLFVKYGAYIMPQHNIDVNVMLRLGYYNAQQLRFAFKVFKTSFLEIVAGMLNTAFDQHYFTDRRYCTANTVPDELAAQMRAYVARLDPRAASIFQLVHFQHWGIHPQVLAMLFSCKDNYEIGCEADHKTRKQLEGILCCTPRDFHLLHMLVMAMVRHCRIQLIPLSCQTAEAQERALRVRAEIPDYRVPRPELYTNYFCPVCECVCTVVTPPCWLRSNRTDFSGFNIVYNTGDSGHDHARWDVMRNRLVCRRPTMVKDQSFQEAKQQHTRAGGKLVYRGHDRVDPNAQQREARELRKTRFGLECRGTPLVPVCFIGAALRIGSHIVVACETDFAKTELGLGTFGPNGITCTAHTHDPWSHLRPYSLLYDRMGPVPLPANPNAMPDNLILATRGFNWAQLCSREASDHPSCGHFGLVKQLDAMLRLVQARSIPLGTTGATAAAAAAAAGASNNTRSRQAQYTLTHGSVRTLATVGHNSFVVSLKQGAYAAETAEAITKHATYCYFCARNRPAKDDKWAVTVSWDKEALVIIFLCEQCTRFIPSIQARGVGPHLTVADLDTMRSTNTPVLI